MIISRKCIFFLFAGLLLACQLQAQDSLQNQQKSVIEIKSAVDSVDSKSTKVDIQKPLLKPDSSKPLFDSAKVNSKSDTSKAVDEKKIESDTLTVNSENAEADGFGESKIKELSNLISSANIFYTIIFLLFGFVFVRVITFILNALAERSTKYRIAFKGSIPIVKIVGWVIIIFLVVVVIYKPSVASMLAVSASIGVAIGFASQDILKNIFGGIVILLDRPFVSGDKIEVDKYYGEVVKLDCAPLVLLRLMIL